MSGLSFEEWYHRAPFDGTANMAEDWKVERGVFLERIKGLQNQLVKQDAEREKLIEALEEISALCDGLGPDGPEILYIGDIACATLAEVKEE
jgi:hypothetical protein